MQACSLQGNNAGQRDAPIQVKHQLTTAFRRHFATFFVFRAKSGVWRRFSGQKAPASRMVGRHASGNRLMTRHFAIPYFPERRQPPGKRKKLPHSDSKRVASAIGAADRTGPSAIGAVGARAGRSGQRSTQTRTRDGKSHEPGRTAKRTTPGRTKKRPLIERGPFIRKAHYPIRQSCGRTHNPPKNERWSAECRNLIYLRVVHVKNSLVHGLLIEVNLNKLGALDRFARKRHHLERSNAVRQHR